jgi:hypothetical protein
MLKKISRKIKLGNKSLEDVVEDCRDRRALMVETVSKRREEGYNPFERWWQEEQHILGLGVKVKVAMGTPGSPEIPAKLEE